MNPDDAINIGMKVRPAETSDVRAVTEVLNAHSLDMLGKKQWTEDKVRLDWQEPGFDIATDTRVVLAPDNRVIGYGDLGGSSFTLVRFRSTVRVHPDFRGKCVSTYLNRWTEVRAREKLHQAPEGARVVLQTVAPPEDYAASNLLHELGMVEVRYSWQMEIALDEPPPAAEWPEGVSVRARGTGDSRAIYEARCAAFKDDWGMLDDPSEEDFALWQHRTERGSRFNPSLWFLAEEGERIVGFSLCVPTSPEDPDMGWIDLLGVLRPWRRRGLGLALLLHSLTALRQRGLSRAGLFVDAQSLTGATRLYEKAGMKVTQRYVTFEKELRAGKDLSRQSA